MLFDHRLFCALLTSLAACTAPRSPVAPSVTSLPEPEPDAPPLSAVGPASRELTACLAQARVAAMVAARPGEAYPITAGCASLIVENTYSANLIVTRLLMVLDGSTLIARAEPAGTRGPLARTPVFTVFLGPLKPGKYTLQLLVELQGDGTGPTNYMKGYRFEVRSKHAFTIVSAGGLEVRTVFYEKNPLSPKFEERPAIRYLEVTRQPIPEPAVTTPAMSSPKLP